MKKKLAAVVEKGDKFFLARCPDMPEAYGQGRTQAQALKDLAKCVAFLLQCDWEESRGINTMKPKKQKERIA